MAPSVMETVKTVFKQGSSTVTINVVDLEMLGYAVTAPVNVTVNVPI